MRIALDRAEVSSRDRYVEPPNITRRLTCQKVVVIIPRKKEFSHGLATDFTLEFPRRKPKSLRPILYRPVAHTIALLDFRVIDLVYDSVFILGP